MPLYEYRCDGCGRRFEKLVARFGDRVSCPGCGGASVEKQLSTFAVGAASSRSEAACAPEGGCGAEACGAGACAGPGCGLPN
jgi:putative FmdB family regulatory protein